MTTPSTPADAPLGAESPQPAGSDPSGAPPSSQGGHERAVVLVTLVLILAASAAFLRAQTLKLEPSPLKRPRVERFLSPVCRCGDKATATLTFTLRRDSRLDAQVLDEDGRVVRTVLARAPLRQGRRRLEWDGRNDAGRLVRDGSYQWRLVVDGGRDLVLPSPMKLDTEPPRVTLLSVAPREIAAVEGRGGRRGGRSPNAERARSEGAQGAPSRAAGRTRRGGAQSAPPRDARAARRRRESAERRERLAARLAGPIVVRYRASEVARAILLVDGRAGRPTSRRPAGVASLEWRGRLDGRPGGPGVHELSVRLRDRAGNLGVPTRSVRVRVRPPVRR